LNPDGRKWVPIKRISVALIADTHGYLDPRIGAIVATCDAVVHAGDIGNAAVLHALKPRQDIVVAIRGNNDVPAKWPSEDSNQLTRLEDTALLELPGGNLIVVHGDRHNPVTKRHQKLRQHYTSARAIVYGHSHRLVIDDNAFPWILNPGAAGRVRTYGGPSCLILSATHELWQLTVQHFPLQQSRHGNPPTVLN
jgi:putative phosphoesterase